MKAISFEWNELKNEINKKKHGISFEEALTVFDDPDALIIPDPDHSDDEERFVIEGMSIKLRLLVVVHCLRFETIRLISARKATKNEAKEYSRRII